jgi:hypothetical protein
MDTFMGAYAPNELGSVSDPYLCGYQSNLAFLKSIGIANGFALRLTIFRQTIYERILIIIK